MQIKNLQFVILDYDDGCCRPPIVYWHWYRLYLIVNNIGHNLVRPWAKAHRAHWLNRAWAGEDYISKLINYCKVEIATPLTDFVSKSLKEEIFSNSMKLKSTLNIKMA